jgi:hypothetical protein
MTNLGITPSITTTAVPAATTRNLILDYYDRLPAVIRHYVGNAAPEPDAAFSPGFDLPELDEAARAFFAVAEAGLDNLGEYSSSRLLLLDLMRNPGTNTTKTVASLLIVARAVEYIRRTGERILIFSPTSANKGTALRDAVARAITAGLVTPDRLRVVTLAPASCREKLRGNLLSTDAELRALNPVLLYDGPQAEDVKTLGRQFVTGHGGWLTQRHGANVWYTLELRNYIIADAARAFLERDVAPAGAGGPGRTHAHAVSSAFGLLGYALGRDVLEGAGLASVQDRPGFLLVQHLDTPDMVLSLHHGSPERAGMPRYALDPRTGLFEQAYTPHFPRSTFDPDEVLDPTFYTRAPATSPQMNELIRRFGGSGIVVSLSECLARYPFMRPWFATTRRPLPSDFRSVREWSLVMATTGVLNAIDRGLIADGQEIVIHGSGFYTTADYQPLDQAATTRVSTVDDIVEALR